MGKFNRIMSENLRIIKCKFSAKNKAIASNDILITYLKEQLLSVEVVADTKVIWMFWDSGLDEAPEVVKLSYQSWKMLNPDYSVRFLDEQSLTQLLGFDFFEIFQYSSINLGAAGKSDLLRLHLLNRFGGIWADATTFCKKPLSEWLDISDTGFFCFREKKATDRQLVSWFLASDKNHPIISSLLERSIDYIVKFREHNLDVRGLKSTYILVKDKSIISKSGSGYVLLNYLETKFCAPYFWMFYLFNEVAKDESTVWKALLSKYNDYAELDDGYDIFIQSVVSKQTYRDKYLSTGSYKERHKWIIDINNH